MQWNTSRSLVELGCACPRANTTSQQGGFIFIFLKSGYNEVVAGIYEENETSSWTLLRRRSEKNRSSWAALAGKQIPPEPETTEAFTRV